MLSQVDVCDLLSGGSGLGHHPDYHSRCDSPLCQEEIRIENSLAVVVSTCLHCYTFILTFPCVG